MDYKTYFTNVKTIIVNFPYEEIRRGFPMFIVKKAEDPETALGEVVDGLESSAIKPIVVWPDEFLLMEENGDELSLPQWARELAADDAFKAVVFVTPESYFSHERDAFKEFLATGAVAGTKVMPKEGAMAVAVSKKDLNGLIRIMGLSSVHLKRAKDMG